MALAKLSGLGDQGLVFLHVGAYLRIEPGLLVSHLKKLFPDLSNVVRHNRSVERPDQLFAFGIGKAPAGRLGPRGHNEDRSPDQNEEGLGT
jgi:hypothetical protein